MKWFKRSLLSITRKPIKTILLFLAIFVIGNFLTISISIFTSTNQVRSEIMQTLGPKVTIYSPINYETHFPNNYEQMFIQYETVLNKLAEDDSVDYANINLFQMNIESNEIFDSTECDYQMYVKEGKPEVSVINYGTNYDNPIERREYRIELLEGRVFTQDEINNGSNKILISDIYQKNDGTKIEIGDFITFYYSVDDEKVYEYKMEVIGIFKEINKLMYTDFDYMNCIFMPNKNVKLISDNINNAYLKTAHSLYDETNYFVNQVGIAEPVFKLNSVDDLDGFISKAEKEIDGTNFDMSSTRVVYDSIAGTVENLLVMSKFILTSSLIGSIFITVIVILISLNNRKDEMATLLSLGEYRRKIKFQFIFEIVIISMLALNCSLVTGSKLANGVSKDMVSFLVDPNIETVQVYDEILNPDNLNKKEILRKYEIAIDSTTIISIELFGGLLVLGIATIYTNRLVNRINNTLKNYDEL